MFLLFGTYLLNSRARLRLYRLYRYLMPWQTKVLDSAWLFLRKPIGLFSADGLVDISETVLANCICEVCFGKLCLSRCVCEVFLASCVCEVCFGKLCLQRCEAARSCAVTGQVQPHITPSDATEDVK